MVRRLTITSQHFQNRYRGHATMEVMIRGPWSITSQHFQILYVKMTPQGIYSIKIFVSLFDDPSRVIHYSKCGPFWSRIGSFEQEFRSILGQNEVNLIWISLILSSILEKDFIDFHWFLMNLLWLFTDFLSIFSKG